MKKLNIIISLVLAILITIITPISVSAATKDEIKAPNEATNYVVSNAIISSKNIDLGTLNCKSAIIVEVTTGKVLFEKNSTEKLSPASITKIMSVILVMEAIESGKLKYTDMVTATAEASKMGGSQIWLEVGEQMTVDNLLRAVLIGSANDATVALAEAVAGSEDVFVQMMNEKAASLNMKDTLFQNVAGLDEDEHYTTAADIAIMSAELLKHTDVLKYTTTWMDSLRDGKTQLVNTNKLVRFYEGITGLKTGTTGKAGNCLSASAKRGEMHVVSVIMGCSNNDDRYGGARKMLDYAFANFTSFTPIDATLENNTIKVHKGEKQLTGVYAEITENVVVPKGAEKDINYKITLAEDVVAPVAQGQVVGSVSISLNNEEIGSYQIKCAETIEKMSFMKAFGMFFVSLIKG